MISDKEILQAALVGLEAQRRRVEEGIIEIQRRLNGGASVPSPIEQTIAPKAKKSKKRTMSPEAKARIAAAQKKRWAAYKKQNAKAA
jgi:hypothetical protein